MYIYRPEFKYGEVMTKKLGVKALRQGLPEMLEQVEQQGLEVVVTRNNVDVAKLVPLSPAPLPRIIALTSLKGGVGKTTIAVHLAQVLVNAGHDVVVLDTDSEHSSYGWAAQASNTRPLDFAVVRADPDTMMRQAREYANAGTFVLIDTPPNDREILKSAAAVADLVVVPLLATGMDVDRMTRTLILLSDIEAIRPDFTYALLLNRCDNRKRVSREVRETASQFPIFETVVPPLTAYETAFGKAPKQLEPFESLWGEVVGSWGK